MFSQKPKHYDSSLFVLIGLAITLFFIDSTEERKSLMLQSFVEISQTQYNTALHGEKIRAERFYDDHAHHIAEQLARLKAESPAVKSRIRESILDEYQSYYDNARNQGLGVLHIFDAKGNSFIRFHQPEKYGDNLVDIRPSIHNMVSKQLYTSGFEIGRLKEAYRHVFPLFFNGEFVGGIEFSVDFSTLASQMKQLFNSDQQQFLLNTEIEKQLFMEEYNNLYQQSELLKDYSIAIRHSQYQKAYLEFKKPLQNTIDLDQELAKQQTTAFFITLDGKDYHFIFIPIYNTSQHFTGYSLSINQLKFNDLAKIDNALWVEVLLFWVLWSGLYYFWHRKVKSENFSLAILDKQSSLLALTNGDRLMYANKSLLNFLGFERYSSFIKKYDCICDLFIEGEGFLSKHMEGVSWTEYIIQHPDQEHKAKFLSHLDNKEHILQVQLEPFAKHGPLLVTLNDITKLEIGKAQLEEEVRHDPLTSAFNRRAFDIFISEIIHRNHPKFSLVLLDIDFFKKINDTYGHDIGDQVLVSLTKLIRLHIRDSDYLIRWGGEEFIIILDNTDIDNAEMIANKLRIEVCQFSFPSAKTVHCSFGVSQYRTNEEIDELINRCDQALYFAKEHGRNQVVIR